MSLKEGDDMSGLNYKEGIANGISEVTMDSLRRYIESGVEPGGFLTAVLENRLHESLMRADANNLRHIKEIISWVYWYAPSDCWGSPEEVDEWLAEDNSEVA
tara:strand:- start:157 stop:462 length:306 start_codon:yes stop_codon:yes gene_type:complete